MFMTNLQQLLNILVGCNLASQCGPPIWGVESYCRKNGTAVEPELCRFAPRSFVSISRDLFIALHVWLDLLFDSCLLLARATKGDVC
jgi:hypothetical protein